MDIVFRGQYAESLAEDLAPTFAHPRQKSAALEEALLWSRMSATAKKSLFSQPVHFDVDGPRAKRANATNAYLDCPCCSKRYLMTELEEHVNRCLLKQGGGFAAPQKKGPRRPPTKRSKTNISKTKAAKVAPPPLTRSKDAKKTPPAKPRAGTRSVQGSGQPRAAAASPKPPAKTAAAVNVQQLPAENMVGKRSVLVEPKVLRPSRRCSMRDRRRASEERRK